MKIFNLFKGKDKKKKVKSTKESEVFYRFKGGRIQANGIIKYLKK